MSTELALSSQPNLPTWMQPQNLDQALALADRFANSEMIPKHFKGDPGGFLAVLDQAQRWNMSPIAVAQCTSLVHGKLCYEGKLVHAVLQSMGAIREPLRFEYDGPIDSDKRSIKVSGTLPDGRIEVIEGTVGGWKTTGNGSPWKKGQMDTMLAYRGARNWARLFAPAALLGVYTPDEAAEIKEAEVISVDTPAAPSLADMKPANEPEAQETGSEPESDKAEVNKLYMHLKAIDSKFANALSKQIRDDSLSTEQSRVILSDGIDQMIIPLRDELQVISPESLGEIDFGLTPPEIYRALNDKLAALRK